LEVKKKADFQNTIFAQVSEFVRWNRSAGETGGLCKKVKVMDIVSFIKGRRLWLCCVSKWEEVKIKHA
jgi:hypothetical protein